MKDLIKDERSWWVGKVFGGIRGFLVRVWRPGLQFRCQKYRFPEPKSRLLCTWGFQINLYVDSLDQKVRRMNILDSEENGHQL